jgi:PAS domain S-box-containing protein
MAAKLSAKHRWPVRYAAALVAVGAGVLLRLGLTALAGEGLPTYITFYPVVMAVALLGGFGPGLVATFTTTLVVDYLYLAPTHTFGIESVVDAVGLAFFSGMGVFMSVVAELYRRARQKAAGHDADFLRQEAQAMPPHNRRETLLLVGGLALSLGILGAVGWKTYRNLAATAQAGLWVSHTHIVDEGLEHLVATIEDMEASERGYLIVGEEDYLRPFNAEQRTVADQLAALKRLTADNPAQGQRLAGIEALVNTNLAELKAVIEARRSQGLEAARALMAAGQGQALTEEIRRRVTQAEEEERSLLIGRTSARDTELRKTRQAMLAGGMLSFVLLITVFLFLRQENVRRRQAEAHLRRHERQLQEKVAARTADLNQANVSLRQQRQWLKVTLNSIGDAVLATDTAGHITFLNPIAELLTGWPEHEALGRPFQEVFRIINEETRAPGEDIVARVLREGRVVALANHTALVTRSGGEVPIEDSAAPIKDSAGTVSGVVIVFHDVAEKRRAQAALRESERQFRTLADSIPNLAWRANSDGYITWYNQRWFAYTGTTPQQMEGWGWQSVLDPQALPGVMERWKASLASGKPFDMTFPLRGADGVFRSFLTRVMPLKDAQGRVQQWFGTNTDVSEQQAAEATYARLAAIVESSDDAILGKDLDGTITSWNAGAERLFGYRAGEIVGGSIRLLLPPERQDEEEQIMARLRAGERVEHIETVRLAKDGRRVAVSVTVSPLKDGAGRIIGASKIIRDISQRKQAEEAEQRLNAELRQRLVELQAAHEEVQTARQAALSLAEDALEARQATERVNADLRQAIESLDVSRRAAVNLMDDAVKARQQAERASAELVRLNRTLRAHSKSDQALLRATDESDYLAAVCRLVVEDCGHAMVWVGFAEEDEGKTVRPAAQEGYEAGYLETLEVTWADTERGRGPVGTAIRTGQPSLFRNLQSDPGFAPWRAEAAKRGYASALGIPLLADGRVFGALTIYSLQPDAFGQAEVILLTNLAADLAYGISALRLRAAKARAEDSLRQTEERYRGLVELSPEAVFVNRNDRLVLANPAAVRLFGAASVEQLLGKSPFALFHPECHSNMRERISQVLAGQGVPVLEEKLVRLDGAVVDVEVVAAPVPDQGERAVLVLMRDITERKRAKQRTELLAETASRLLAAESPQAVVEDLCRKVLALLDAQVFFNFLVDEASGRLRLNASAGISAGAPHQLEWLDLGRDVSGCVARDGCCVVAEDIQHTPDARTETMRSFGLQAYACHPLLVQGRVLGTVGFGTRNRARFTPAELSLMSAVADQVAVALDRQRAQVALQQIAEDLRRSNHDLEQFAYVASHDLQEPLRAVSGYVMLLEHRFPETLDAKARSYIAGAFEGASRMERLIMDLLAYSRVDRLGDQFAPTDLNAALEQALSNLQASIKSTQAAITRDPLPTLFVDATQIMQLFQNLIGNALKFHGASPLQIHVGAQRQEGRWVFSVRDNGIGIEPQYFERIFRLFQRLHTRKEYAGTGIGLAICKKVVERHGGTIWIESQLGQGATFSFSLPDAAGK